MYFPVGWPKQLDAEQNGATLTHICTSQDRLFFAVLTKNALSVWYCKPAVRIVSFRRSDNSVCEFGTNVISKWKADNTMVAVTTSKGYILFYNVEIDPKNKSSILFTQQEDRGSNHKELVEHCVGEQIPALKLTQSAYIQVLGGVKGLVCLREELMVATGNGRLQRIKWDGVVNVDMTIELGTIPFAVDLQHSRASQLSDPEVHVTHFQYSPLLGGFAVVLSNGRAAFITASTLKFEPMQVVGVWAQEMSCATAVAVNHKYTLMAFGGQHGQGIVYHLDELTGALMVSHKLVVSDRDFPDAGQVCGAVRQMKWTPDGCALALTWQKGGFSLWSVFGALLLHSMGPQVVGCLSDDIPARPFMKIKSMEWASEGYYLWMVSAEANLLDADADDEVPAVRPKLLQLQFVKSALTVNPCMTNHEHLFLQGEDKLYLNPEDSLPQLTNPALRRDAHLSPSTLIGSKQWQIVPIPHAYLSYNWPIRFTAVNSAGHCVAVAGRTGFAHYALFSRRWKLFGNEFQERDMVVTGGLLWWEDFICVACFNLLDQRDEIRFYPRDTKLDNTFCSVTKVPSQIMLLNTFRDILVVLCSDCHIMMFRIERNGNQGSAVNITKIQEVAIGNFIPHPANVVAITLTTIRTDTASVKIPPEPHEPESIILNVAGRLLMFQRDRSGPQVKPKDNKDRPLPFCAPVIVASSVENMWLCPSSSANKPHLTEALWLGCGASGVKAWLPLHHKDEPGNTRAFMSKRIMLPFQVDIFPLSLLFESGILIGATSESISYHTSHASEEGWPYLQLERTSQVYLHQILRQLLRRNLGVHALEVARSCTELPFFPHVLELLLHRVLEEEATSKDPIPDPLLPRVVAFVQEFPEFLQTVAHCARKSEVALWQYLFATVGNPKDLFEECLVSGNLDTAASYLIILQNLEKPMVARQHATLLLDGALEHCNWDLARDLVRFLGAIDPSEVDAPQPPAKARISTSSVYPTTYPTPPMSPSDSSPFVYPPTVVRGRSMSKEEPSGRVRTAKPEDTVDGPKYKEKLKLTKSDSAPLGKSRSPSGSKDDGTAEQFFIDQILSRHARKLLGAYRIRDLACFAANLEDYQLIAWLRKEKLRAARVDDYVAGLKRLHEDFHWPLPILTLSSLQRISSMSSLDSAQRSNLASPTGDGSDLNGPSQAVYAREGTANLSLPRPLKGSLTPDSSHSTAEVVLVPQVSADTESHAGTEQSDASSFAGEADSADSSSWSEAACLQELEQLSAELANQGPPQSQLELRYLFHMLLEAGCLEWSLLVAMVLRDAMSVVRTVNTASMTDVPLEMVARMREGLSYLELWANTECFGYKPFFQVIDRQAKVLQKIGEQTGPGGPGRVPVAPRLSTSSTESVATSTLDQPPHVEREVGPPTTDTAANGHPDASAPAQDDVSDSPSNAEGEKKEEGRYDCVLS